MKDNQPLPAYEPVSAPPQAQSNFPKRILVVDDDAHIRQLNAEVLRLSGYEVDGAVDGAAGWEMLSTNRYHLLITDNKMPKVTGVELVNKMSAAGWDIPVIMATGKPPEAQFTQIPGLVPPVTLLKPYTVEQLLAAVKNILPAAADSAGGARPRAAHACHRILVVDNDHDMRRLYCEALAHPDYHVDSAEDGADAWEALQASTYQLLITDHELPKLTGLELVRKLRAAHSALPVILATTTLPTDEIAADFSLRIAATLVKPFPIDTLLDSVKAVLHATVADREETGQPNWPTLPSAIGLRC